jgi:hypothetical protein
VLGKITLTSLVVLAVLLMSDLSMADDAQTTSKQTTTPPMQPLGSVSEERTIPATTLAMGGASTVALAAHGAFLELASRRRARLERNCGDLCPDYRVDEYKEARRMAGLSLSVGVLAAASSVWLMYNDPDELLRLAHRGKRVRRPGLTLKLKPRRRGVWATMVARF